MMLSTQSLSTTPIEKIVDVFNDAFSQYEVPIDITDEKLHFMIRERSVRLDHSFGLFDDGYLAGFVLNGSRDSNGLLTGYDSGTGIRTEYQGKGYGRKLLRDTISRLMKLGYRKYLLEVLVENTPAIALYEREGFEVVRTLHCYRASHPVRKDFVRTKVESKVAGEWQGDDTGLLKYQPSWQNSDDSVASISDSCSILRAGPTGHPQAFAVIVPESGRFMQLGWSNKQAFWSLIDHAFDVASTDTLSVINLPESEIETSRALTELGFERFVSQFEMELNFSA